MKKDLSNMSNEELWKLFPIVLSEYNPKWVADYRNEKEVVERIVGKENIERINHIGSTAVPGLKAKPTVDILLEIKRNTDVGRLATVLCENGYIFSRQPCKPAPHLMFMKGYTPEGFAEKVFHLHVRFPGDWDELYFRDYLIAHPDIAQKYGELKSVLSEKFRNDRDGYTDAKGDFIRKMTENARKETGNVYS